MNNAGRQIFSPNQGVSCYVYGYQNALTNDQGDPMNLNEFIDWIVDDGYTEVNDRREIDFGGDPAVKLVTLQQGGVREAIYSLGEDTGRGFFCTYENLAERDKYRENFNLIAASYQNTSMTDEDKVITGTEDCQNLLNGVVEPLKDLQTLIDFEYTEVTTLARASWDKNRMLNDVVYYEEKGYTCFPMPLEFDESTGEDGEESAVTKVEWSCELKYDEYKYFEADQVSEKDDMAKQGYTCKQESCFSDDGSDGSVWLCTK